MTPERSLPWPGVVDRLRPRLSTHRQDALYLMDWPGTPRHAILHIQHIEGTVAVRFLVPDDASDRPDRLRLYEARPKGPLTMPGWSSISRLAEISACDPRDLATLRAVLREVARSVGMPAVPIRWQVRVSGHADATYLLVAFDDADLNSIVRAT